MAGRCGTVERGDFISAVDGVGQPRIWRAAIYFLSAALVDAGGSAGVCSSVECCAGSFYCCRADDGGTLFFCAGAAISAGTRGAIWSGVLCGESVRAFDRLYAE